MICMEKSEKWSKFFDKDTLIDTFDLPIQVKDTSLFLIDPPYNGLRYYISSCIDGVYEFSPDGYEQFIKFSDRESDK